MFEIGLICRFFHSIGTKQPDGKKRVGKGLCYNHVMAKRKGRSPKHRDQWMRDKDLRSTVLLLVISLLVLCLVVLYILAIVDPKGYLIPFSPVTYVFSLYKQAGAGGQLAFIQVPLFTFFGYMLRGWVSKK